MGVARPRRCPAGNEFRPAAQNQRAHAARKEGGRRKAGSLRDGNLEKFWEKL
jgi:hypothetical protein